MSQNKLNNTDTGGTYKCNVANCTGPNKSRVILAWFLQMSFKDRKEKNKTTLFTKYHCPFSQSDKKGMGEKYTEKGVSFFKAGNNQNLKICNQHHPNSKKNSLQLQQVSSLVMSLIKNIFSLKILVTTARNSIPQILSSKSHF